MNFGLTDEQIGQVTGILSQYPDVVAYGTIDNDRLKQHIDTQGVPLPGLSPLNTGTLPLAG
jgi:hypothetical protein